MSATSSFKTWLSETEATRDPAGDLIGDLKSDDELPNVESAAELTAYMRRVGACTGALEAVSKVWERFRDGGER
jgi:hypothetical protein